MKINSMAGDVLGLFAQYGFRKVSMSDIAKTAKLSRQSIYNQFGSKEAVLEWSINSYMTDMITHIAEVLEKPADHPGDLLAEAFQKWMGNHVPMLRTTPHGNELLDIANTSAEHVIKDFELRFREAITAFIERHRLAPPHMAEETAYVLQMAGKGLLHKVHTSEDFAIGMQRVLRVIFR
ncbi:TetR/AcrR family transcriptional regulator [Kiloniella sp. b19]|uniref:TetR/AcrR family transcriptional regulator n=1 Tax=Kiloniella sp. GXU_MW_B19 TaxID=3141326 RepID=UPI0031DDE314